MQFMCGSLQMKTKASSHGMKIKNTMNSHKLTSKVEKIKHDIASVDEAKDSIISKKCCQLCIYSFNKFQISSTSFIICQNWI